jgi:ketosteroid isomerase-like protein
LHENIIEEGFQILNIETTDVEISGNLAFIIQNLKGNQGDSVAMLALKREQNGQWRVCAEAEVS